ncbi:MAG: SOS response-associated peptidase family protein [Ignavibacteria bacterium]|nr:SOS response-associated peptidase family protein [Ignavibacteria bacterium]
MCTSFNAIVNTSKLIAEFRKAFQSELILTSKPSPEKVNNIRPTDEVLVIRKTGDEYILDVMRWGFKLQSGIVMVNSRIEEIIQGRAADYWQSLLKDNPCLFVMSSYIEWKGAVIDTFTPKGKPTKKKIKQPYKFTLNEEEIFLSAGYFRKEGMEEACTIITTEGNDMTRLIHEKNRMPVILNLEEGIKFLNGTLKEKIALCRTYPPDKMNSEPAALS